MTGESQAFTCQMCGRCCLGEGGIVVSSQEQKRLAVHLNIPLLELKQQYTVPNQDKSFLKVNEDGYCIFFSERGCTVHPAKPDVCRAWPFFRGNLIDESSWELSMDYCPGLNRDVTHEQFCRQGKKYLLDNGLLKPDDEFGANALKPSFEE